MFGFATSGPCYFIRLSSGNRMPRRSSRLAYTVKHRSGGRTLSLLWRTPSCHRSPPLRFSGNYRDAIATAKECQISLRRSFTGTAGGSPANLATYAIERLCRRAACGPSERARHLNPSVAPYQSLVIGRILKDGLGFAAPRRLREDPQRIRGFSPALLLELCNPIGYGFHHIARRFTSHISLRLNDGFGFFALLNYSDCFLV